MSVLEQIVATTRAQVEHRRRAVPLATLERAAAQRLPTRGFHAALREPGIAIIAEHKRRSPSAGVLREGTSVTEIARAYERGGAAAMSVLTEPVAFGGSLEDLGEAHAACSLPLLRKDFIVDAYQLYESVAAGADAVLLIVAALPGAPLAELHEVARELCLDVLVEIHDRGELERALELECEVIGINNRDLTDFSVDLQRTFTLLDAIPTGTTIVSESGFSTRAEMHALEQAGVDAVLVGGTLMRAGDVEAAVRALAGSSGADPPVRQGL